MTDVAGLVLAAGAGRRYGGPKALARAADGTPWLTTVTSVLAAEGIPSLVVVPKAHPQAAELLAPGSRPAFIDSVAEGLSASLRAGLENSTSSAAQAALITLVDLPSLPATVIRRVLDGETHRMKETRASADRFTPIEAGDEPRLLDSVRPLPLDGVLRRAVFDGRPGHPVLIGRDHWPALMNSLEGDSGANDYLRAHGCVAVECADLWDGLDVDAR